MNSKKASFKTCLDCGLMISSESRHCIKCGSPSPFGEQCRICGKLITAKNAIGCEDGRGIAGVNHFFHSKCVKEMKEEVGEQFWCQLCKKPLSQSFNIYSDRSGVEDITCKECGHVNETALCATCGQPLFGSQRDKVKHKCCSRSEQGCGHFLLLTIVVVILVVTYLTSYI